jgi:hypothetical protein
MRANEDYMSFDELLPLIEKLRAAAECLDRDGAREVLKFAVAGYEPVNGVDDLVWSKKHGPPRQEAADADKVIDITTRRA